MDFDEKFMMTHERLRNNGTLKVGDWLPSQEEMENYRKKVEEEKQRQDEFFKKQVEKQKKQN
jgi:hypothetical protein